MKKVAGTLKLYLA